MSVFCDTNTPEYVQLDCGVERAGVVAVALIDDAVGEPSDAELQSETYWNTLLNQSPPLAYRIMKTRGEYARPTVTTEEGFGRESNQNTSADHLVTFEVEGILANRNFWESANRKKWKFVFVTAGDILHYVNAPVTVDGRENNPRDIKVGANWSVEARWADFSNPRVVDAADLDTFQE